MNKTQIHAEIVGHSLSPQGDELISVLCTFPRIILAEVNTHRMLSKNTSSSRAIPFKKMVESVQNNPFIPFAWQKEHKGMQGSEYFNGVQAKMRDIDWEEARDNAVEQAKYLNKKGVTKQLCNRLLEPFMWTTMLITGSREGWDNFFHLRCPDYIFHDEHNEYHFKSKKDVITKFGESEWVEDGFDKPLKNLTELDWLKLNYGQAEIHMMTLAEEIYDAVNESTPKQLQGGEWHIPFEDKIPPLGFIINKGLLSNANSSSRVKISTAMAARTSYTVVGDEKDMDYQKMIELHDRLIAQDPPHSSPLEHCARAMSEIEYTSCRTSKLAGKNGEYGWCGPYKGFMSYRYFIDNNLKV